MTVAIRPATSADGAELLCLAALAWSPLANPSPRISRTEFFSDGVEPEQVVVATLDDRVVGCARVFQAVDLPSHSHCLEFEGFAVHPDHRDRGIGSAVLDAAMSAAASRGARKVLLRVLATNPRAQALYGRHGFEVEGVLRGEFCLDGSDVDDILMSRWLP